MGVILAHRRDCKTQNPDSFNYPFSVQRRSIMSSWFEELFNKPGHTGPAFGPVPEQKQEENPKPSGKEKPAPDKK